MDGGVNFRSRELLNLAYELDCTMRVRGVCEGGRGEPAHANSNIFGKGGSIKADDCFFAACCRKCHVWLDQGSHADRETRFYYWLRAHAETMRELWKRGLVRVA